LRLIRRPEGDPSAGSWNLLGVGLGYGMNRLTVTPENDTVLTVKSISVAGNLSGRNLLTVGIPVHPLGFARILPDTTIFENQTLRFTYVIDSKGPTEGVFYSLLNPPAGASIDSTTGVFRWTPTYDQAGRYTIVVSATDGQNTVAATAIVSVLNTPRKPVLSIREPSSLSQIAYNVPITFKVSILDPEKSQLTISWIVNGSVVKTGRDTAFTYQYSGKAVSQTVRAVFTNEFGLSDSTEWSFIVVDVAENADNALLRFELVENYPNPFNPRTSIRYHVAAVSHVTLKVFDVLGREVASLVDQISSPGSYTVAWDAGSKPSGIYIYRMSALGVGSGAHQPFTDSKKMLLAK